MFEPQEQNRHVIVGNTEVSTESRMRTEERKMYLMTSRSLL